MADGIKIPVVLPWGMVAVAALSLAFMYRDVQNMKASMVSVERIAKCEAAIDELKEDSKDNRESIKALWRAHSDRRNP